jgi:hypothetical protein
LPTILFRAPSFKQRGEFDYLKHVLKLAGRKSDVVVKTIENANHTFSNRTGRDAVLQQIEIWLASYFPRNGKMKVDPVPPPSAQDIQIEHSKSGMAPVDKRSTLATECALKGG